jgi:hypothetical protein
VGFAQTRGGAPGFNFTRPAIYVPSLQFTVLSICIIYAFA